MMFDQQQQEKQERKRSRSKSPANKQVRVKKERESPKACPDQKPLPVISPVLEEVKVQGNGNGNCTAWEKMYKGKMTFDLQETLREKGLENYREDQITQVRGEIIAFC